MSRLAFGGTAFLAYKDRMYFLSHTFSEKRAMGTNSKIPNQESGCTKRDSAAQGRGPLAAPGQGLLPDSTPTTSEHCPHSQAAPAAQPFSCKGFLFSLACKDASAPGLALAHFSSSIADQ